MRKGNSKIISRMLSVLFSLKLIFSLSAGKLNSCSINDVENLFNLITQNKDWLCSCTLGKTLLWLCCIDKNKTMTCRNFTKLGLNANSDCTTKFLYYLILEYSFTLYVIIDINITATFKDLVLLRHP